ncbi:MAG: sigma-70 family RNA polymerase sigma factor [Phycisphaeraceae bacterium]|nr:MAG: sigma-70 family RNA polymerase sigma factor [Phycisphaeraceae bacterium]
MRTPGDPPRPNTTPDALLIRLAGEGDEGAFAAIFHRHKGFVARVALHYTRDHERAADVVQDVFIYLMKKLPTLYLTAKLTTYLYPIAKNLALTANRKARPPSLRLVTGEPTPDEVSREPIPDLLHRAVQLLPEHQQEVLILRFVEDLGMEEIALALAIPTGTVKSRLHLAIKSLRENPETRRLFPGAAPGPDAAPTATEP